MNNEFTTRPEVIFIEYDKVIKNADQFLLHKICTDLFPLYKDMLNIEALEGLDIDSALTITSSQLKTNIFESLLKEELPFDEVIKSYRDLYNHYPEMYDECDLLEMGRALFLMANQKFTEKIVIWSPTEDPRIADDLLKRHGNLTKVEYRFGDPSDVLKTSELPFTSFIIANTDLLEFIVNYEDVDYSEIMIAGYRFNKYVDEDDNLKLIVDEKTTFADTIVKIAEFRPVRLESRHVEKLIKLPQV